MRLRLAIPASWRPEPKGGNVVYLAPEPPGMRMLVSPLLPLPDDPAGWLKKQLVVDIPAGAESRVVTALDTKTAAGWPATLLEAEIRWDGGSEARVLAMYQFLWYAAAVILRCPDAEAFASHRAAVVDMLGAAAPDFSGQGILCLEELFVGPGPAAGSPTSVE